MMKKKKDSAFEDPCVGGSILARCRGLLNVHG
jgi:hypothetical protein